MRARAKGQLELAGIIEALNSLFEILAASNILYIPPTLTGASKCGSLHPDRDEGKKRSKDGHPKSLQIDNGFAEGKTFGGLRGGSQGRTRCDFSISASNFAAVPCSSIASTNKTATI